MSLRSRSGLALTVALAAVLALALWPRTLHGLARPRGPAPGDGWYSIDPDGLYHTRRVERALREGLPAAETDPYLSYPDAQPQGSAIPWPPYYDTLLALALKPFAPADLDARRTFLERTVATMPVAFGLISASLAALATWLLTSALGARPWARGGVAAFAGLQAGLGWGAINYSRIGTGDHHAWVEMLHAGALCTATLAWRTETLRNARRSAGWGALCGLLAGLMLGSWVAALLYVVLFQACLGWLWMRRAREDLPGVATFSLSFHVVAALTLAPALASSPWTRDYPWMVVNLSWFHGAWLLAGALASAPLCLWGRTALSAGTRAARLYPAAVVALGAAAAAAAWLLDAAPARGVAEGFAWVTRADAFMDSVKESAPLVGARAAPGEIWLALSFAISLLPLCWAMATWSVARARNGALLAFVVVVPVLVGQALTQKRFSDAAAVPSAVLLGWALARVAARVPSAAAIPLGVALALASNAPSVRRALDLRAQENRAGLGGPLDSALGERLALEWVRGLEARGLAPAGSVLAHWDRGHVIEWAADRPSVATNFGSYVGVEGYRAPARFYLEDQEAAARALLEERRVRFVFAPATLPLYTASMARIAGLDASAFLVPSSVPGTAEAPTARWQGTMLARLMRDGWRLESGTAAQRSGGALDFLRLVHVSAQKNRAFPAADGNPRPAAAIWEFVPGARVRARGDAGERLEVRVAVGFGPARPPLEFARWAVCDESGSAEVGVPYSTDAPAALEPGTWRVLRAEWRLGARLGALEIPEAAVRAGLTVDVP